VDAQFAAFLAFTTMLVLTPGATTAVVVRNVLAGGRSAGVTAAVGAALANATWALVAGLGMAAALGRAPIAYALLRYGGAAYLAFLGVREVTGAWRTRPSIIPGGLEREGDRGVGAASGGLRQGLTTNLLNPPIATFYLAVVPTFLPATSAATRFASYAAIHVSMAFAYHCSWALALHALRRVWARPAARRTIETLTGAALLGLAWKVVRS
jgi:threonine/homoserine/homoserine lactone efflux protein